MTESRYPKVQVLLSTYNGDQFVKELVKSILGQSGVDVRLLIRDDGSTDTTLDILDLLAKSHPEIELIKATNCGVVGSFFELLSLAKDSDFYAFADQDDIWKPDKLISAVMMLESINSGEPTMYYCLFLVDSEMLWFKIRRQVVQSY